MVSFMIASNRWTELQEVAGSASAVPLLQSIVNATPDGAVSATVEGFVGVWGGAVSWEWGWGRCC